MPSISVAMATYNGEKFLREQLDSILCKSIMPCEIIIVDDCSTDGTMNILREYEEQNPIIRVFQNDVNTGPLGTFRRAFFQCSGDYIAPSDQDDIWYYDKLERCLCEMSDQIKVVFHQDEIWYENGTTEITRHPTYSLDDIIYATRCSGHTCMFAKEVIDVFKWTSFICYDWAIVLYGLGAKAYKQIDYVGCRWRRHPGVLTNTVSLDSSKYHPLNRTKWKKVYDANLKILWGRKSTCIQKDAKDQELILSHFLHAHHELQPYIKLTRCFQKQSFGSMFYAGLISIYNHINKQEFKKMSLQDKLANISFAFRYPYTWWLELSEYLESINCY